MSEGDGREPFEVPAKPDPLSVVPLTDMEIASGIIIGESTASSEHHHSPTLSFDEAMDACLREALQRPPCLVAFSGGRDSSAMLAWAVGLARREGLDLPVPATHLFPAAGNTDEDEWQEMVITHLGLSDWQRMSWTDELDLLGPYATVALRRHGLLWPDNSHFLVPIFEAAHGGSVVTGIGGDELFEWWPWVRAAAVLGGRQSPELRDVLRVGLALAPGAVKRYVALRRSELELAWLRPEANRALARASAAEDASMPLWWPARVDWLMRRRYLFVNRRSAQLLAGDSNVEAVHPLLDSRVADALARSNGKTGYRDRTTAYAALFAGILPTPLLDRRTKTWFDEIFWHRHSREFASNWSGGTGLDELIDEYVLRQTWTSDAPDGRSAVLLQHAWLDSELGSRGD